MGRSLEVVYRRGVHLPEWDLWLDPREDKPFAFVSHAHSDHIGRHRETILSAATSKLMHARLPGSRLEHALNFREPAVGIRPGLGITLFPAGHIAGSAQSFIQAEDGASLLYTGDFKLRPGLSAEAAEWTQADTLIMETTFGLPRFQFPPTREILADVVKFCHEAMEDGVVPVLFGYSLGKSQEILCALFEAGLPAMLHGAVYRMTEVYREIRPDFPTFHRYSPGNVAGHVLICPPSANHSRMLQNIKERRTAVLTGWALQPGAIHRYQTDAAFPLSDHADYPDLLRLVEMVKPRRVLTLHGYAAPFARDLRDRGIEAWALTEPNQMELTLALGSLDEPAPAPPSLLEETDPVLGAVSEFADFARVGEAVAATTGKLRKVEILCEYFRTLDDDQLAIVSLYLAGRAFAQSDPRVMKLGGAVIWRAFLGVTGMGEARLREVSRASADLADVASAILPKRAQPHPLSLADSRVLFDELERARGPLAKTARLEQALARLDPPEARYVVKIVTGDLRIGLKEGLLEEALAAALGQPAEAIREANMLLGDLGKVARLARAGRLDQAELTLFQPIKCMLASPEPTSESIWQRWTDDIMPEPVVWVEDKFDGVRTQLHRGTAGRVELYSRDLRQVTEQFDEIAQAASALSFDAIFDGEIVAYEKGQALTFFDLQKRLGRRTPDLFMAGTVPITFLIFDLLYLNGQSLLTHPLSERRKLLESLPFPDPALRVVDVCQARSPEEIEQAFKAARIRRNEGLIIKDPASLYTPGRRGLAWLKLKKELATLDVVVVGAEWGHGKRNSVLSDYTFSVRDETSGELRTIGKAYSGLTDVEILELTSRFQQLTLSVRGKYHEVRPEVVLEIAFDSVQPSSRHQSGLALRFPRIKTIRQDKTPADIDTVAYARSLVG